MKNALLFVLTVGFLISALVLPAQLEFVLGTESFESGDEGRPAAYATNWRSAKQQYYIAGAELQSIGMEAGPIQSIAFDVVEASSTPLQDFTISIGFFDGNVFEFSQGLTQVFSSSSYAPVDGWNAHDFNSFFQWDGISDIVIETCFANPGGNPGAVNSNSRSSGTQNFFSTRYSDYGGGTVACGDTEIENFVLQRPNIRFTVVDPNVAPTAQFSILSYNDCSGTISLLSESFFIIDDYLWYFGDGSTSTEASPMHSYSDDGVYDISLVVSNAFGSDSIGVAAAVTVDVPDVLPVQAECSPETQNTAAGFGSINVTLANINNDSPDGSVGYESYTCQIGEIQEGQPQEISVTCAGTSQTYVTAYIDWSGDGSFSADELILSQQTGDVAVGQFNIPTTALTDSVIRLRVITDFFLQGQSAPCTPPSGGQVEDYSVRVLPNELPPIPIFSADPLLSCDGFVQFTDLSENVPDSWLWQFGDGEVSTLQSPGHTYDASGTYDVTLTAENAFGQVDTIYSELIVVDLSQGLSPSACTPQTTEYCCGYGLIDVTFAGISNASADGVAGYEDFTCGMVAQVVEGMSYPYSFSAGGTNPHDIKVYIDSNDDGFGSEDELVLFSGNAIEHTGTIVIPENILTTDQRIRMRIVADFVGSEITYCYEPLFGQTEDYSIIVNPDMSPPTASFAVDPTLSCDGIHEFISTTSGNVDSLVWYFGDGASATGNPVTHEYVTEGAYTVSLVAINEFAQDSIGVVDAAEFDLNAICDTLLVPITGADFTQECPGILLDDGGSGNYSNGADGHFIINTDIDNIVELTFSSFSYNANDSLIIYDGSSITSPVIGAYSGGGLPGGGVVSSSGPSMTIRQKTNGSFSAGGFVAEWQCAPLSIEERRNDDVLAIYPNPASSEVFIRLKGAGRDIERVRLFDSSGRMVEDIFFKTNSTLLSTIDVSHLAEGLYTIQVDLDTYSISSRVLLSR